MVQTPNPETCSQITSPKTLPYAYTFLYRRVNNRICDHIHILLVGVLFDRNFVQASSQTMRGVKSLLRNAFCANFDYLDRGEGPQERPEEHTATSTSLVGLADFGQTGFFHLVSPNRDTNLSSHNSRNFNPVLHPVNPSTELRALKLRVGDVTPKSIKPTKPNRANLLLL